MSAELEGLGKGHEAGLFKSDYSRRAFSEFNHENMGSYVHVAQLVECLPGTQKALDSTRDA